MWDEIAIALALVAAAAYLVRYVRRSVRSPSCGCEEDCPFAGRDSRPPECTRPDCRGCGMPDRPPPKP